MAEIGLSKILRALYNKLKYQKLENNQIRGVYECLKRYYSRRIFQNMQKRPSTALVRFSVQKKWFFCMWLMPHILQSGAWLRVPISKMPGFALRSRKSDSIILGLKVKAKLDVIMEGDVAGAILETANKEKVSLVIMGAHGKSLIESILLGSVATNVLRYGKAHVLIMRFKMEGEKFEKFRPRIFSKVLFPTDFSEPAREALLIVKNLEGIEEIVLVHVVDRGETQEEIDANVRESKKKLEDTAAELCRAGLKMKVHLRVGSPPDEINSVAEGENVSLIAMSTRGMGVFRELLLGGTARDAWSGIQKDPSWL